MIGKIVKYGLVLGIGTVGVGGVLLGTDACSFFRSSFKSVRTAVRDQIPLEFELKRARDLLDEAGPEMRQNVRLIAEQEVEIAHAKADVRRAEQSLAEETQRVQKLRECLAGDTTKTRFTIGNFNYGREQLKTELARRFERFTEAEQALAEKKQLLEARERSVVAAMQALEAARAQRAHLEAQIENLEAKHRLAQAASSGSDAHVRIDNDRLAQAEKLVAQIRKQLEVNERMLAHDARFTQPIPIDVVNEKELLEKLEAHFDGKQTSGAATAKAEAVVPGVN